MARRGDESCTQDRSHVTGHWQAEVFLQQPIGCDVTQIVSPDVEQFYYSVISTQVFGTFLILSLIIDHLHTF